MADGPDQDEKTEEASGRRLQRAFEEGQLPIGRDAIAVAGLALGVLVLFMSGRALLDSLVRFATHAWGTVDKPVFGDLAVAAQPVALVVVSIAAAAAVAAAGVALAQTKGGLWADKALPDVSRLFEPDRFFRLFSKETLQDLGVAALKVVVLGWVAWSTVASEIPHSVRYLGLPSERLMADMGVPIRTLLIRVGAAMVALAAGEWWLSHWRFQRQMRMTKDEVKREHKEDEGDPLLRGRRRRKHREMATQRARVEVPKADALVVNPTHIAVAIRYRRAEGQAPRVTAKGKGHLADLMRSLARENGIPIVEDKPLARLLHRKVKIGAQVPEETFKAVAAVLTYVYRVTGRQPR